MYIEDSGSDGDIKITVDGEEYDAEANYDVNNDGLEETAFVETDEGYLAFSDTDGDGDADLMRELDENGKLVGAARFDEATGQWVAVDPGQIGHEGTGDPSTRTGDSGMTVNTPEGDKQIGAATEDVDGDGKADTTIVKDADGDTTLFTDTDEDGDADAITEITADGEVTIAQHTGDGDWTVVEHGHIDSQGNYVPDEKSTAADDSDWGDQPQQPAGHQDTVRVDPATGEWVGSGYTEATNGGSRWK